VTNPGADKLKMVVNQKTGNYSGTFHSPVDGKVCHLRGVIFTRDTAGEGYFLDSTASGTAQITTVIVD
jgi:hypothetical protein